MKEEESDNYRCLCAEGYRLMEDNKTCLEKGNDLLKLVFILFAILE